MRKTLKHLKNKKKKILKIFEIILVSLEAQNFDSILLFYSSPDHYCRFVVNRFIVTIFFRFRDVQRNIIFENQLNVNSDNGIIRVHLFGFTIADSFRFKGKKSYFPFDNFHSPITCNAAKPESF